MHYRNTKNRKSIPLCVLLCVVVLLTGIVLPANAGNIHDTTKPVAKDGDLKTVESDNIKITMFDYSESEAEPGKGINNNGLYDYSTEKGPFTFNGHAYDNYPGGVCTSEPSDRLVEYIDPDFDARDFSPNRTHVLPHADENGYPIWDGKNIYENKSLGYLFGAGGNGVWEYPATNTFLSYDPATMNYSYNSLHNAVDFDTETGKFYVRNYRQKTRSSAEYSGDHGGIIYDYGDFLPFNYSDGTIIGKTENNEGYTINDEDVNYWFGYKMETSFFQPEDGIIYDNPMYFYFSGDDDVWLFIDGVLALDIGGAHGRCKGYVNFKNGAVRAYTETSEIGYHEYKTNLYQEYVDAGVADQFEWETAIELNDDGIEEEITRFADLSEHTMVLYYTERASACANCYLSFNLISLPDEEVSVTKTVENAAPGDEDTEYEFLLEYEMSKVLHPVVDRDYVVKKDGKTVREGNTGKTGKFKLKNNETAEFNLTVMAPIRCVETDVGKATTTSYYINKYIEYTGQSEKIAEGNSVTTDIFTIDIYNQYHIYFTNTLEIKKSFSLKKEIEGEEFVDRDYSFLLKFNNKLYSGTATKGNDTITVENGVVTLGKDETVTINNLPQNTEFKVSESLPGIGYKKPLFNNTEKDFGEEYSGMVNDNTVVVTNEFNDTSLEVKKTLISSDNDQNEFNFTANYTDFNGSTRTVNFTLTKNGEHKITDIPYGAEVSVTETNSKGYYVSFNNSQGELLTKGNNVKLTVTDPTKIECVNKGFAVLPDTGSNEITVVIALAVVIMAIALIVLLNKKGKV